MLVVPPREGLLVLTINAESPGGRQDIGWYHEGSGFTPLREQATVLALKGEDITDIVIRLPELRWHRITGLVLGPDDQPAEGVSVTGVGETTLPGSMGADGTFSLLTLGGSYALRIHVDGRPSGWYGGEDGFVLLWEQATFLVVEDQDVTDIVIRLPEFR